MLILFVLSFVINAQQVDKSVIVITADRIKAALEVPEQRIQILKLQLELAEREAKDKRFELLEANGINPKQLDKYEYSQSAEGWRFTLKKDNSK